MRTQTIASSSSWCYQERKSSWKASWFEALQLLTSLNFRCQKAPLTKNFSSVGLQVTQNYYYYPSRYTTPPPASLDVEVVALKDSYVKEISISLLPFNAIKSDSRHASQWICTSGWTMWSYEMQWLLILCQEHRTLCPVWGPWYSELSQPRVTGE